jgi:hypothetical protein
LSRREDDFGYGAQALVVQGRPPADGVGQVFSYIGGGGETARTLARCNQAHGLAPWSCIENEGEQKGLGSVRYCPANDAMGRPRALDRVAGGRLESNRVKQNVLTLSRQGTKPARPRSPQLHREVWPWHILPFPSSWSGWLSISPSWSCACEPPGHSMVAAPGRLPSRPTIPHPLPSAIEWAARTWERKVKRHFSIGSPVRGQTGLSPAPERPVPHASSGH